MRFDWPTLALQTVNVLILLWLLRRFLFRPVVEIIAARKNAAERLLSDAEVALKQAKEAAESATRREQALAADSAGIHANAHSVAETERARILAEATTAVAQVRDAAHVSLERALQEMRHELEVEAQRLATAIARRPLARVPPQALNTALLQSLDTWLRALPRATSRR